jgi:hypothetical protein
MRTFLIIDKSNSDKEILGTLLTNCLNFRRITFFDSIDLSYPCFAVETVSKQDQKTVLDLARNTGNLSSLIAVKEDLSVIKGKDKIGKFVKISGKVTDCFIDGQNYFKVR